jgi:hypothetical protein
MKLAKALWLGLCLLIGALILVKSFTFLTPDFSRGFLMGKEDDFGWYACFYPHIFAGPMALFLGIAQMWRKKQGRWHRWLGYGYVGLVLGLAAPAGLGMSWLAMGGLWGKLGFALMAVLWAYFTIKAFHPHRKQHQTYTTRSFIMACSAVWLRILSFCLYLFEADAYTYYALTAWLSWLPFLALYEVWRFGQRGGKLL